MNAILFLLAAGVAEPPPIVITPEQRMEILALIDQLAQEKANAEAEALHWYKQNKECRGKTRI